MNKKKVWAIVGMLAAVACGFVLHSSWGGSAHPNVHNLAQLALTLLGALGFAAPTALVAGLEERQDGIQQPDDK